MNTYITLGTLTAPCGGERERERETHWFRDGGREGHIGGSSERHKGKKGARCKPFKERIRLWRILSRQHYEERHQGIMQIGIYF